MEEGGGGANTSICMSLTLSWWGWGAWGFFFFSPPFFLVVVGLGALPRWMWHNLRLYIHMQSTAGLSSGMTLFGYSVIMKLTYTVLVPKLSTVIWSFEVSTKPYTPYRNSLKKQKSMYKVLTPSINPPYKFLWAYEYSQGSFGRYRVYRVNGCNIGSYSRIDILKNPHRNDLF